MLIGCCGEVFSQCRRRIFGISIGYDRETRYQLNWQLQNWMCDKRTKNDWASSSLVVQTYMATRDFARSAATHTISEDKKVACCSIGYCAKPTAHLTACSIARRWACRIRVAPLLPTGRKGQQPHLGRKYPQYPRLVSALLRPRQRTPNPQSLRLFYEKDVAGKGFQIYSFHNLNLSTGDSFGEMLRDSSDFPVIIYLYTT